MRQKSGPSGLQCILIYLNCCLSPLGLINNLYIFAIINKTLNIITHGKILLYYYIIIIILQVFSDSYSPIKGRNGIFSIIYAALILCDTNYL